MIKKTVHRFHRHCCHGCCDWRRRREADGQRAPMAHYAQIVAAKVLLEVFGAAGAVWGSSDILFLRDTPEGNQRARAVALAVGWIFLVRCYWHVKHWWQHERDYLPIMTNHRRSHRLSFFQIHASTFILQVLGGAGAIWGCAEALTLRNSTNVFQWRVAAMSAGAMFLVRWVCQILSYCLYLASVWSNPSSMHMTALRWFEALVVKLTLEVFGAVGAVWGFSEIVTLRNTNTNDFWRVVAIVVGIIFLLRWMRHLMEFIQTERDSAPSKSQVQVSETRSDEVVDLEANNDLELKETDSSEWDENTPASLQTPVEVHSEPVEEPLPAPSPTTTNPSTPQKRQNKDMIAESQTTFCK